MLIGIGGEIDSGKSTAAKIILKKFGYTEKSFAKNLKEMCKAVFRLSEEQVNTQEGKARAFHYPFEFSDEQFRHLILWIKTVNHIQPTLEQSYLGWDILKRAPLMETPRQVLQFIGTEFCRGVFGDNFHVEIVMHEIAREGLDLNKIVISDARFGNERQAIKAVGGMTLLIEEFGKTKIAGTPKHASETSLGNHDEYDCVYFNSKNLGLEHMELTLTKVLEATARDLGLKL